MGYSSRALGVWTGNTNFTDLLALLGDEFDDNNSTLWSQLTHKLVVSVTVAANAGSDTLLATVTAQPCIIHAIIVHADAAQPAHMTNAAVKGGASKVVTFIAAADLVQADVDAADKQVAVDFGAAGRRLAATKTIVMEHTGTGTDALDLTVTLIYSPEVAGGYLV
jgi:hypothetical protein